MLADEILNLHERLTEHVIASGIGPKKWEKLVHNVGRWKENRQTFILDFLQSFYDNEWKALELARNQMCATPEMWENMEMFFEHEAFPEQVVVKDAIRAMKARWITFKTEYSEFLKQEKLDVEQLNSDD